jgi:hypothetical protein
MIFLELKYYQKTEYSDSVEKAMVDSENQEKYTIECIWEEIVKNNKRLTRKDITKVVRKLQEFFAFDGREYLKTLSFDNYRNMLDDLSRMLTWALEHTVPSSDNEMYLNSKLRTILTFLINKE